MFTVYSLRFTVSSLCSLTLLGLISSTLLHSGKASDLALHSASATPGIESEPSLLSLCATVTVWTAKGELMMSVEWWTANCDWFQVPGLRFNGELRKFYELVAEPINYWRITRIGAGAGINSPCPAGRNLVNLVDFFPSGLCPGAGPG